MLETDYSAALKKICTEGVQRAAVSLNDIIGNAVRLEVTDLAVLDPEGYEFVGAKMRGSNLAAVNQGFRGELCGTAALLFSADCAEQLIDALADDDALHENIKALQSGTLLELGNIVINAIMGTISNRLGCQLHFGLPEYCDTAAPAQLMADGRGQDHGCLLIFVETRFAEASHAISDFLFIFLQLESLTAVADRLAQYIDAR